MVKLLSIINAQLDIKKFTVNSEESEIRWKISLFNCTSISNHVWGKVDSCIFIQIKKRRQNP